MMVVQIAAMRSTQKRIPSRLNLERKVEPHKETAAFRIATGERCCASRPHPRILLMPGQPGTAVVERIPSIAERGGVDIPEIPRTCWQRLLDHPNGLVATDQNKVG